MSGASGLRKHGHTAAGDGGLGATPSAHHTTHENGGSDEIDATGLTGVGGGSLTDHTHAATGTGSNGGGATLQPTTLDIPSATSPAQTAEGRAVWDSDDDVLTVGDGSSRKTLMNRVTTTRGDIVVRGASVDGRLAIGAANTVLHGSATDPAYSAVVEGDLSTSDITTANVVSTKHGFAPKSPADATQFLNGAATPAYAAVKDSDLSTTDITTNDVSTSKHGFAPKAPNDATKFLDGTGAFSSLPAGAGTRVYNSGAFAVSASTETAITFDTERSDSDAFHSTSSQTERLTVPTGKGGRYVIAGTVEWAASALGTLRRLSIRLNGTTYLAKDEITSIINAALPQSVETVYDLVAGDYVELVAFQDTVGSVNLQASGNYSPEFGMMLAGVATTPGVVLLADSLLGSDTASFDFISISGSYKHLRIEVQGRSTVAATNDNVAMIFNNDSGANYDYLQWAFGTGSSFPGALSEGLAQTSIRIMGIAGASSTAGDVGNATISIPDYASTTLNKSAHTEGGTLFARSAQNIRIMQAFGSWRSTAAITRITLTPAGGNWKAGSRATLYGLT